MSFALNKFNERVAIILDIIKKIKDYVNNLPDDNKKKAKYIQVSIELEVPTNPIEQDGFVFFNIYGETRSIKVGRIFCMGFCRDRKMRATVTNLLALVSGAKQRAVKSTSIVRRMPDGSYKGVKEAHDTKLKKGTYSIAAQKTALARRMPDGSYKGFDKTVKTKTDNGIHHLAASKTAIKRRLPNGDFLGAHKTAETRRQRGYLSTRYGSPCVYQHRGGYWIVMRSMWEWGYANWLDDNNLKWEYEPITLFFNGKGYIPDFVVEGGYHEIKPKRFVEHELKKDYILHYDIKVITEDDFNFSAYKSAAQKYKLITRSKKDEISEGN